MPPVIVRLLDRNDTSIRWDYEKGKPFLEVPLGEHDYRSEELNPFPCYTHDALIISEIARICASKFPVSETVVYVVVPYGCVGGSNAKAYVQDRYAKGYDKKLGWSAGIAMYGRTTPIHPAVTRYVTAHEYGHVVAWQIALKMGYTYDSEEFYRLYAESRGIPFNGTKECSRGGLWHMATSEIFADDFRVAVCDVEPVFYHHPGFSHPNTCSKTKAAWENMMRYAEPTEGGPVLDC